MWNVGKALTAAAAAAAAATMLCLKQSEYEKNHFVTEETTLTSSKIKKRHTLVFLSDIHDKEFGVDGTELLASIGAVKPDAILLGGDTMVAKEGKADLKITRRLIHGLSNIRSSEGKGRCPVYYGNGNHEQRLNADRENYGTLYDEFLQILKEEGVHYLSDSSVMLGDDICISGLNIDACYYRDVIPAKMKPVYVYAHLGHPEPKKYQILLAHSPLFHSAYAEWGADLALCGHFHGGTIRLPILGGVMTPQFQFFLPCCAGTFEKQGHYMIVSRGLGTHSINIRLCNRPQLVVVHLEPAG
ncbi:MAG: metallophosphoesterase [Brotaphodocola sp.]